MVNRILEEFGLEGAEAHIINGHIPVEAKKGESPVKCNGKLLIIDGGFSKAYQPKTGIAGYTLIYNSYGLVLAAHEPFESVEKSGAGRKRYRIPYGSGAAGRAEKNGCRYRYRKKFKRVDP